MNEFELTRKLSSKFGLKQNRIALVRRCKSLVPAHKPLACMSPIYPTNLIKAARCLIAAVLFATAAPAIAGTLIADFTSAATVPVTAASYTATGNTVNITLGFAPTVGTNLTIVNNTGQSFITGFFSNLAQGQVVNLSYGGIAYSFVANYYGGTGNDLVLEWAFQNIASWGDNTYGQLGNNSTTQSSVPVQVTQSGVLAGKIVISVAEGYQHNLALCSDGTLAAWGYNNHGQLGNNSTTNSSVPVLVTNTGVLAGKTVIAIAAGYWHSLALCSDGTVAAWGYNNYGQLGNNTTMDSWVPVLVTQTGVLSGKSVVAVTAGQHHSLVLCSDGTVASWGYNNYGQLGNNSTTNSSVPVLVTSNGVLSGKTVISVAGGWTFNLALCSDGTLASWGYNAHGELGNNSYTNSSVPVKVITTGVLSGKTVVSMSSGYSHSLALCSDGTLASWGGNGSGQLGNNSFTTSSVPVLVNTANGTSALYGKTVVSVATGYYHCVVACSDGTLAAWGYNNDGQLGNNSTTTSKVPVLVTNTGMLSGTTPVIAAAGGYNSLTLAAVQNPANPTSLSALSMSSGTLSPTFAVATTSYTAMVSTSSITVTPTVMITTSTVKVNGTTVVSGTSSAAIPLIVGPNTITITVTASDGIHFKNYTVAVLRTGTYGVTFTSASYVPYTGVGFNTFGINLPITLGFTPTPGTNLTVVNNTGIGFIAGGPFSNLAQGQVVNLTYNSVTYKFVVNYYGGTGNDLVLQWAYQDLASWGYNSNGQLGNNSLIYYSDVPVLVTQSGVLAGKIVVSVAAGSSHSLALCSDGTVAAWGANTYGQLGNNTTTDSNVPVLVNTASGTSALYGKTVVAVAASSNHSLALCSDGSVAAWGYNGDGELGNNSTTNSSVPVAVNTTSGISALYGETVVSVAAGQYHNLALCSDGTVVAWGWGGSGQLGNNSTTQSNVPVSVIQSGVLAGKTVISLAAGGNHSLALCSDGTIAAWGADSSGQLGNNNTTDSWIPVLVTQSGVLSGKTVVSIAACYNFSLALSSDGTVAAWGDNSNGQLGNNSTNNSSVPVLVNTTSGISALYGKTVTSVTAGQYHSLALCSDGTVAAWGYNDYGQLGNNSTWSELYYSTVPVLVNQSGVLAGHTVVLVAAGYSHCLALASVQNSPDLSGLSLSSGTLSPTFDPATTVYSASVLYAVSSINVTAASAVNCASISVNGSPVTSGLASQAIPLAQGDNTIVTVVTAPDGVTTKTYTIIVRRLPPSPVCSLSNLVPSSGTLSPSFASTTTSYAATVNYLASSITVTPTLTDTTATINVNGTSVASGAASGAIPLVVGTNTITTVVTAQDGTTTSTYTLTITRSSLSLFTYNTAHDVPVTATSYTATGTVNLVLGFTPPTGTNLTVVNNTGIGFITGQFSNLAQGQMVDLSYGGKSYRFVANYYGGTGNDLVLQWAYQDLAAWGDNSKNQLGINGATQSAVPVSVTQSGVLTGKTVISVAAGNAHSIALCSDGTVAAWGLNNFGQLGNNSGTAYSSVPVLVTQSGVLAGKTVVSVAAGGYHSLALCSDGTVTAWGLNNYGQLGNNSGTTYSSVPVLVTQSGALAGKTVVSVAAGQYHSVAVCSDGTVAAWGYNVDGELGNNSTTNSSIPLLVTQSGVLAGKSVISVAAGSTHSLALCSDGTVAAWGANGTGQLGNNGTTSSSVPVLVDQSGVLAGKTVISIAAGSYHSLALCSDGTVAAWGYNLIGQLGNNGPYSSSNVPVLVTQSGVLAGKTVVSVAASNANSLALCSDGTVAAWGDNGSSQLGNNSTTYSGVPVLVIQSGVLAGKTVVSVAVGGAYSLALCSDGTVAAWGVNNYGQLGINYTLQSSVPVPVNPSGALAGKTVISVAAGYTNNLALCSDGTVAAWGSGSLGNNSTTVSTVPVQVDQSGVLAGKTVVSVAPGQFHSLALCSDGTLVAWGANDWGQLGNNSTTQSNVPVLVNQSGVLAGKTVVSIAAGYWHSLALCSDGTVAAWGYNSDGELGNNSTTQSSVPVLVTQSGVLAGKTVVAVAAGWYHSLALCSDGTVAAWGANNYGQLGNNSTIGSYVPVLVTQSGVLAGKTVVSVAAGYAHSLALCMDGTVAAWGYNSNGQLGNSSTTNRSVPVPVTLGGALAGKTLVSVAAGYLHSLATCSDGTAVAWGYNSNGQLGNNSTTDSSVPVLVTQNGVLGGKTVFSTAAGYAHSLALASVPNSPDLSGLSLSSGTLSPSFDPATTSYGASVSNGVLAITVTPTSAVNCASISVNGSPVTSGSASQTIPLVVGSNAFTIVVTAPDGTTTKSYTITVTRAPSSVSTLSGLATSSGTLSPSFVSATTSYTASVTGNTTSITLTPTVTNPTATITVNGTSVASGTNSAIIPLVIGANTITTVVTAQDGVTTSTYTIIVTRSPSSVSTLSGLMLSSGALSPSFASTTTSYNTSVPSATTSITVTPTLTYAAASVTVNGAVVASGSASGPITLSTGSNLISLIVTAQDGVTTTTYFISVYKAGAINFTYANASQVPITSYGFAATGSSLNLSLGFAPPTGTNLTVVQNTGPGFIQGQFSNLSQGQSVNLTYNNITYRFTANYYGGTGNDLVLQWANNRAYSWGLNGSGQLGINTTINSAAPVAVTDPGIFTGKTLVAISAGASHSLALCADGTLASWGNNGNGRLGNNSTTNSSLPVSITSNGVLSSKMVVAVAAGTSHSLALCSDGTVAAWGNNLSGQLGNNSTTQSLVPVAVSTSGVLAGKTVVSVAAGSSHCLALCSDGTVAAWGNNSYGQLGNNSTTQSNAPVAVNSSGVLAGKTVVSVYASLNNSVALCSDGTVATWGVNTSGQLGNNSTTNSSVPVLIAQSGVLAGKTVVSVAVGGSHCLVLCADGTLAAWGSNVNGQLGNNSTTNSLVPVSVNATGVLAGKTVVSVSAGQMFSSALCSDGTLTTWGLNNDGQLGNNSTTTSLVPVDATPNYQSSGEKFVLSLGGCASSHTLAISSIPLTLSSVSTLASLEISSGTLSPVFASSTTSYTVTVTNATTSITVTPTLTDPTATVTVDGTTVASGTNSAAIPIVMGTNTITTVVTAQDGVTTSTYTITVTSQATNSYDAWMAGYPGVTGSRALLTADPVGDGLTNLQRYAFGGNPTAFTPGLQYTGTFAGGGTITGTGTPITSFQSITCGVDFRALFIRRTDYVTAGLTYTPQFSATLDVWQNSTDTPVVLADNGTWQVCSVPYPFFVDGRKAKFFRISVSMP